MTLLRQYRFASFMLVLVALIAFSVAVVDLPLLFVSTILAMLSWYVTEGPRGKTLPTWVSNILVVVALAWAVFTFVAGGELAGATSALGRFLLWLLLIKLFAARTPTEDRQRFALSTMIVLAGCLESVQFAFGALVILYAGLAIWTVMLRRLHIGAEQARASRAAAAGFSPPLELTFGRRAAPQFRGLAVGALVLVFISSIGVFVLFPRLPAFNEMRGPRGARSVSGFTDEIRLRGSDRITESRRELFTVRWLDSSGQPVAQQRPLLMRGAVLDRYDPIGERWVSTRTSEAVRTIRTGGGEMVSLGRSDGAPRGTAYRAEVEMRSLATSILFTIYAPVAIATKESRTIAFEPSTLLVRDISSDRGGRYWSYAMLTQQQPSAETLADMAGEAGPDPRQVAISVAGIEAVAQGILDSARRGVGFPPEPSASATEADIYIYRREVARAIADWMQRNFTYTTDLSLNARVPGEDPIISFLTRYRTGHCEYFASALCAVLRALGIESRIVTGYIALEYEDGPGHYIVRESNAHAWVEVRTGRAAWTAVDATPEDSLIALQEQNRSFADNFRWIYGTLEFFWNSRVVSYDGLTQAAMAERVQSGWRESIGAWLEEVRARMRSFAGSLGLGGASRVWFTVIAIGLSTAALAFTIVLARRRRLQQALRVGRVPKARRRALLREGSFYAVALSDLARAGLAKPDTSSPLAHARSLRETNGGVADAFEAIAREFYRIRFGGDSAASTRPADPDSLLFALRSALRQNSGSQSAD